ncbi:MAG: hypothetical protein RR037_00820 [Alistipes sp.]
MKTSRVVIFGLATLFALMLSGCSQKIETGPWSKSVDVTSYMMSFKKASSIRLVASGIYNGITVQFDQLSWRCNVAEQGKGGHFDELCLKYGDTKRPHQIQIRLDGGDYPQSPCANADAYTSIAVSSTVAWDAKHPAGVSLNDLMWISSWSYSPYIRSGYTLTEPRVQSYKKLNEVTALDLMMLGGNDDIQGIDSEICRLLFAQAPAASGIYPITVTLTTDEGEVFSASTEVTFTK